MQVFDNDCFIGEAVKNSFLCFHQRHRVQNNDFGPKLRRFYTTINSSKEDVWIHCVVHVGAHTHMPVVGKGMCYWQG